MRSYNWRENMNFSLRCKRKLKKGISVAVAVAMLAGNISFSGLGSINVYAETNEEVDSSVIVETQDFEAMTEASEFGFSGGWSENLSIATETVEETTNSYLLINSNDTEGIITKSLGTELPRMSTATISFKWLPGYMYSTDRTGMASLQFKNGDNLLLNLYAGDTRDTSIRTLYYSSDRSYDLAKSTGVTVESATWYEVSVTFDFVNRTAEVSLDGEVILSDVEIAVGNNGLDTFAIEGYNNGKTWKNLENMGLDDFSFSYVENTSEADPTADVYQIAAIEDITVTPEEYATYAHPQTVVVTFTDGMTEEMEIDQSTWVATPTFDSEARGVYTWTADIVLGEHTNSNSLKASYRMLYKAPLVTAHDYENTFTFEDDITTGTGFAFKIKYDENNNGYLNAEAGGNGNRSAAVNISESAEFVKGAEVSFDWMPSDLWGTAYGQIEFISHDITEPFLTLRYDYNTDGGYRIYTFTKTSAMEEFDGCISEDSPTDTGIIAEDGNWFNVKVNFDYINNTADLTIVDKDNAENIYTVEEVAINESADSLKDFGLKMLRMANTSGVVMNIDNLIVDYVDYDATDIIEVVNPADVSVGAINYGTFSFPKKVVVKLGDGSATECAVGEWTVTPKSNLDTEENYTVYVCTADLVAGDLNNNFGLGASFELTYVNADYSMTEDFEELETVSTGYASDYTKAGYSYLKFVFPTLLWQGALTLVITGILSVLFYAIWQVEEVETEEQKRIKKLQANKKQVKKANKK